MRIRTLMERADHILIQGLNTILRALANLRERLDNSPEFESIVLHLLSIDTDWSCSAIATCHFFDICLKWADVPADDFRINDFALFGDLCMGSGGESN